MNDENNEQADTAACYVPDWLAKPALDVGLFTNDRDGMLAFWQGRVGVAFSELLPLGGGVQQHRHAIGDSVLKINHSRELLPDAPAGGIRRVVIARGEGSRSGDRSHRGDLGVGSRSGDRSYRSGAEELRDPDGNRVVLVPPGALTQLRVELTVSHLASHQDFYGNALGLPSQDDATFRCGASQIHLTEGDAVRDPPQRGRGYRYLTIQVFDVRARHREILRHGGREGRPPVKLGDVAHISFVRDPDGNWIEVSQRKSITGSLD